MVTHYSTNGLDSACGRSSQTLVSTAVTEDVSCKSCQRSLDKSGAASAPKSKSPSLAELRKTAKAVAEPAVESVAAKPAAKVVSAPVGKPAKAAEQPARRGGFSVKAAWAARLAEQGDRCRLPRGKAKQRHV
ncbi:hypothetical protein C4Q28_04955 [Pseudomonas sp. SWI6]|uniref:Uncharacterized protein n=1 Tax=Pseudomonas taiwanensis TaxID=470150 RepID=A0ABR6V8A2_9PSED|nr:MULTISPECIES: hypothetical protein [Pseudomonas]AGZ37120.1 hypothetical protein PVLB_21705 [Pseudomonas sp. VLB120]AVD81552.1 hypothetical protein C4Q28_04955 [Pseudomonas sp. SWI6]AVD88503.1 hypothetical protein C4Q26_15700 [Pseudomonas sp. SWI44]MBC3476540.1 hypothetical protein [Pseudomonas taiwanensis]MBC3490699.1 hypothetical protein [Pseudomonas taiwanensis]